MRKSKSEAAATRERIVEAASQEFRRNGIDKTGLVELMSAAGLSHGGFYKHFESKDQVVAESIAASIEAMIKSWKGTFAINHGVQGLKAVVTGYLSSELRDDVACGCPFAALASEVARSEGAVREVSAQGFSKMIELIANQLVDLSPSAASKKAQWIFSSMVGAVVMSRMVIDQRVADQIIREARTHILATL